MAGSRIKSAWSGPIKSKQCSEPWPEHRLQNIPVLPSFPSPANLNTQIPRAQVELLVVDKIKITAPLTISSKGPHPTCICILICSADCSFSCRRCLEPSRNLTDKDHSNEMTGRNILFPLTATACLHLKRNYNSAACRLVAGRFMQVHDRVHDNRLRFDSLSASCLRDQTSMGACQAASN